jgi:AcrR family transcriptional regulator
MKGKRSYDSPLRRAQAAGTRDRILEAVSELVAAGAIGELTVPAVAARAGVTVRTVYRHFPTRADMVDAMQKWALQRMGALTWPKDVEELLAFPVPLFEAFDRNRPLVEAQLGAAGIAVRREGKQRRVELLRDTLAEILARCPAETQRAALGVIKQLLSASAWQALREDVGLDGTQAGRAVAWAIGALVEDLRRTHTGGAHGTRDDGALGRGARGRGGAAGRAARGARGR